MSRMWPEGMVLTTYTYGPGTSSAWSKLLIHVAVDGDAEYLLFDGQPFLFDLPVLRLPKGVQGSFQLPAVDQPGVSTPDGLELKFFAFDVTVKYIEGNTVSSTTRHLQPLIGQADQDLDTLPAGGSGTPEEPGGNPGDGVTLGQVQTLVAAHVAAESPHPAYDSIQDLTLLFENGLI